MMDKKNEKIVNGALILSILLACTFYTLCRLDVLTLSNSIYFSISYIISGIELILMGLKIFKTRKSLLYYIIIIIVLISFAIASTFGII